MKTGLEIIAEERYRQMRTEGFDRTRDKQYVYGELAIAASIYAKPDMLRQDHISPTDGECKPIGWPWSSRWWKPSPDNRIKELAKAGALIAAEIDRLILVNEIEVFGDPDKNPDDIKF